ncbi:MAG: hypothetical protein OHK0011_11970 [Turneriella sp.]
MLRSPRKYPGEMPFETCRRKGRQHKPGRREFGSSPAHKLAGFDSILRVLQSILWRGQCAIAHLRLACCGLIALLFLGLPSGVKALQGESIFLKAYLGAGYSFVNQKDERAGTGLSLTGPIGMSMLQAGGSLSAATKLFAFTAFHFGPALSVKAENLKIDTQYSYFFVHDLGVGLAYYLSDGISISVGGAVSNNYYNYSVYQTTAVGTHTRHGWASHLIIGKELSTSGHFSLGVSLLASYNRVLDVGPSADAPVSGLYFGLAATAMYD